MHSCAKDISAIGTNMQRTILLKKMNDLVYDYKMEYYELEYNTVKVIYF